MDCLSALLVGGLFECTVGGWTVCVYCWWVDCLSVLLVDGLFQAHPQGHALLLGISYCTGRATLTRLAAYITHCKVALCPGGK